ncbi:MAG TPA: TetR/AcrR family transcriptional regulator [Longimicrobium sp.]|nr:TetR/AcrR family transcriptional regulator [Longimicrobium sp.]
MGKGTVTRERIIGRAVELASVDGLNGLTLGRLAEGIGMSKSGLFAHFRSKEELQRSVLETTITSFRRFVYEPGAAEPRGEPRLRSIFERWLAWQQEREEMPGGCLLMQASTELDDQPGPLRDLLVKAQRDWRDTLIAFARGGITAGHFRAEVDPALFAFQLEAIILGAGHDRRLLRDPLALSHARAAFEALLASARTTT